jgi:hypothetical protein
MRIGLILCLQVLLMLVPGAGEAQVKQRFQIGIGPYGMLYTGDLSTQEEWFHRVYPGMNLSLQFDTPKLFSPQLNAGFGKITGEDRNFGNEGGEPPQPNNFVSTNYFYFDGRIHLQFFKRQLFRPRLGAGIGIMNFTPKGKSGQELQSQIQTRAQGESYNTTVPYLPMTIGFKYKINRYVSLGMDYTRMNVFTDYIDNIGELGPRDGNDKLDNLLLSLYFTPAYKKRPGRSGR